MCVQSSCLLSDVDVLMSKVHVLLSEINQKVSKCPVAPTQLLPRVGVILSEMELIVALSQSNSVDNGDDDESLDWDNYDYNHHTTPCTVSSNSWGYVIRYSLEHDITIYF